MVERGKNRERTGRETLKCMFACIHAFLHACVDVCMHPFHMSFLESIVFVPFWEAITIVIHFNKRSIR